jgi:hypothetical protein
LTKLGTYIFLRKFYSVHKDVTEGQTDGRKDGRKEGRKEGRTDSSITISLRNFVGKGIISLLGSGICFCKIIIKMVIYIRIIFLQWLPVTPIKTKCETKVIQKGQCLLCPL